VWAPNSGWGETDGKSAREILEARLTQLRQRMEANPEPVETLNGYREGGELVLNTDTQGGTGR
jgi:hypothetical protein